MKMKKNGFLLDTNSLLYILKTKRYQKLDKSCHVLDLTFYEYGDAALNLLAKRGNKDLTSREEIMVLLEAYEKVSEQTSVVNSTENPMPEIFELARKENLTFYDASYLYCARRFNLHLITEDERLMASARRNSIDADSSDTWAKI